MFLKRLVVRRSRNHTVGVYGINAKHCMESAFGCMESTAGCMSVVSSQQVCILIYALSVANYTFFIIIYKSFLIEFIPLFFLDFFDFLNYL